MSHDEESRPRRAPPGYMTRDELGAYLGKEPRTLERWDRLRSGPPVTYVGQRPLYRREAVETWLREQERPQVRASKRRRQVFAGSEA